MRIVGKPHVHFPCPRNNKMRPLHFALVIARPRRSIYSSRRERCYSQTLYSGFRCSEKWRGREQESLWFIYTMIRYEMKIQAQPSDVLYVCKYIPNRDSHARGINYSTRLDCIYILKLYMYFGIINVRMSLNSFSYSFSLANRSVSQSFAF